MIICKNVIAGYGGREVLHGIDFFAEAGESVALVGPNGSGKTTLLRVISGVLAPFSGSVSLNGQAVAGMDPKARARLAAVVPQRPAVPPRLTVREFVLLGRYPHLSWFGNYGRADYVAAERALAETGSAPLADRRLDLLSGGEMQRVALARALAQQPRILLLDELSAGLDLARMVELFELLEIRRKNGCCLVLIMHDLNLAALYATRFIGLKEGGIVFQGPTREFFDGKILSGLYGTEIDVFRGPHGEFAACPRGGAREN